MAVSLCPRKIACPASADALALGLDDPIANYSSEGIEPVPPYLSINFPNPDPNGTFGGPWKANGCVSVCTSSLSQADANVCALSQATQCVTPPGGTFTGPGDDDPIPPWQNGGGVGGSGCSVSPCPQPKPDPSPPPPAPELYCNGPYTVVKYCPDGSANTYTFPAGALCGKSQAAADGLAGQLAGIYATFNQVCIGGLSPDKGCVGNHFEASIGVTTDYTGAISWDVQNLPSGLSWAPEPSVGRSVKISGTPESPATSIITVKVSIPGVTKTKTFQIGIIGLTPTNPTLPATKFYDYYDESIAYDGPLDPPVKFSIINGRLPHGLSLNEDTGSITGTTEEGGDFRFTVQVEEVDAP